MRYFYSIIFIFLFYKTNAQNPIGIPQINTYSSADYKGGSQNWGIDQDKSGVLYFANNEGLLTFDGRHWKLYPLPNSTIVRSVKIAEDGKIYVGAQDEVGYFFPDVNGTLIFNSLKHLISEKERQFSDIWNISIIKGEIFFRTNDKIFHLKDKIINVYKPIHLWQFMGEINGELYVQDTGKGLLSLKNNSWKLISSDPVFLNDQVTSILPYSKDIQLLTTLKSGLFLIKEDFVEKKESAYESIFRKQRIYAGVQVNENWYAIATSSAGCFIIDKNANIIQQFSSEEGLYKDNLRSIFQDKNKNLWLGLNDGINLIAFNNAIKYIFPDKAKQLSSYSSLIYKNKLYVGTSNGVLYNDLTKYNSDLSYSKQNFKEVANTAGQVWSLKEINDKILVGHEDGAIAIDNNIASTIYNANGTWLFESLSPYTPTKNIITGTYYGLQSLEFENGKFINKGQVKGLSEALRFLVYDNNYIWSSHPYRGVYRLKISDDKKRIIENVLLTEKDGLPSSLGNYISKIKNRMVVATAQGIYEFDYKTKKFKLSELFTPILKNNVYHFLKEDNDGNVWFVSNKKVGVVSFKKNTDNKEFNIVHFPELTSQVVAGFENIYPYNNENVFIGSNKGLIHINFKKYIQNIKPIEVTLSLVKSSGKKDSIIYGGYFLSDNKIQLFQDKNNKIELENHSNSLYFEYSSTLYEQQNNIEFSYQLIGFDKDWSSWTSKGEKDYTNLPHGNYVFKVKARNNLGNESKAVSFSFTIKPAWYETFWIYIIYLIALSALAYLLVRYQKKKHLKEQEFLKLHHQREIEDNEKEIVKLQNEKLEADVNFKNKELATTSMHLVQKNKLLSKIKEELLPLVKLDHADNHSDDLKKVLRLLNEAEKGDADWENFAVHFDHVHSNFLSTLKEKFPNLSSNDLKLCAYLKMNLSSKEMAQLMSITIRAVEVSRYRLRKKLNVASDVNLFDYLISVTSSSNKS